MRQDFNWKTQRNGKVIVAFSYFKKTFCVVQQFLRNTRPWGLAPVGQASTQHHQQLNQIWLRGYHRQVSHHSWRTSTITIAVHLIDASCTSGIQRAVFFLKHASWWWCYRCSKLRKKRWKANVGMEGCNVKLWSLLKCKKGIPPLTRKWFKNNSVWRFIIAVLTSFINPVRIS